MGLCGQPGAGKGSRLLRGNERFHRGELGDHGQNPCHRSRELREAILVRHPLNVSSLYLCSEIYPKSGTKELSASDPGGRWPR